MFHALKGLGGCAHRIKIRRHSANREIPHLTHSLALRAYINGDLPDLHGMSAQIQARGASKRLL